MNTVDPKSRPYISSKGGHHEIQTRFIPSSCDFNYTAACGSRARHGDDFCTRKLWRGWVSEFSCPPPQRIDNESGGEAGGQPLAQQQLPTASNIPVRSSDPRRNNNPRLNGKFNMRGWPHGLDELELKVSESIVFGVQETESKVRGRLRFSCAKGSGAEDGYCQVQIMRMEHYFDVTYEGDVTASLFPIYNPEKMFPGIDKGWATGNNKFCNPNIQNCLRPYDPDGDRLIGGQVRSNELNFSDRNSNYYLVEDKTARIPANHGWKAKRYFVDLSRFRSWRGPYPDYDGRQDVDQRMEAIVYTHPNGQVNYGRWLRIDGPNDNPPFMWTADGSFGNSRNSNPSLGSLKGKVTYKGGATGYYALKERRTGDLVTRPADAGHFTARATFQADLNDDANLWIEGSIHDFVDQDGQKKNWSVELQREQFSEVNGGNPRSYNTGGRLRGKPTIWTVDGTPADPNPNRKWDGYATSNGRYLVGAFQAVHGTDGRMVGSFGAER